MTTSIYFVRHAEPNYENHDDRSRELTAKGLQDSQDLVKLFDKIPIDAFYSSPYRRAIDTIHPLAQARNKRIHLIEDLRERKITDKWIDDFEAFAEQQWKDFHYHLEDGESLAQVQERMLASLEQLLQEHPQQNLVIGSHGTALATVLNYYRPEFGWKDFQEIKHKFPWIVRIDFQDLRLISINEM